MDFKKMLGELFFLNYYIFQILIIMNYKELQVINDTINRISHFLSKEISEYSNGDIPWRIAKYGEALNYEAVFYRNPEYSVRDYDDEL